MPDITPPERVKYLDAPSLRALAHPLRNKVVASLRLDGPATATVLAQRLGESSGLTSYHLRVLADHGFVEELVGEGTGRERWWRAVHTMTSWQAEDFLHDPDERATEDWLAGFSARNGMERLDRWLRRRATASPEWVAASDISDYMLRMTPDRLRALMTEIHELVGRYRNAAVDHERAAPTPSAEGDGEQVVLLIYAFPRSDAA